MRKSTWGTSVHQSGVSARVCVVCGYIALFAVSPGVFKPEAAATRSVAGLPIPVEAQWEGEADGDEPR
jgi:hypothetical protein